jgi:hypothetical protein
MYVRLGFARTNWRANLGADASWVNAPPPPAPQSFGLGQHDPLLPRYYRQSWGFAPGALESTFVEMV